MTLHPAVQLKAQSELDRIVGRNRLPEFSDRPHLPYIEAILKEVLRWKPLVPLGMVLERYLSQMEFIYGF